MNEHQKIAEFLYGFLCTDHVTVPGSRANDVQNAKGWLAAIVQGQLHVDAAGPPNPVPVPTKEEAPD